MSQTTIPCTTIAGQQRLTHINPRIILLALGMFALGTDAFIVAGVLPVIVQDTGVTEGLVGQLITVFSLTYGLGAPILPQPSLHRFLFYYSPVFWLAVSPPLILLWPLPSALIWRLPPNEVRRWHWLSVD